jgi:catechol 2,3-dioxygenase-like lactoylglutathione lyase family enzyme
MEKVTGIGGIFFKSKQASDLAKWYRENLGLETVDGAAEFPWRDDQNPEQTGRTVWSLFAANSEYFGPGSQMFMVNYRVTSLDRMLEQLTARGVKIERTGDYDYGRFAWITDPDGNRLELWEPPLTPS